MHSTLKLIGYRPSPEAREAIAEALASGRYVSPGHVLNDAVQARLGKPVAPPARGRPSLERAEGERSARA